jgi:RNA polymerase sigma-B factor
MQTSDSTADFVELRRTRDPRLREAIVQRHVGLAYSIARRFEGRGEERDDLRQVALFALAQSIDRFDPDRGVQFSTFAAPTITGNLKRHLRDHTWLVRPPRAVNERALAVAELGERLTRALQRPATPDDIAAAGGWDRRDVEDAVAVLKTHRLHERVDIDVPDVENDAVADDVADRVEDRLVLDALIDELDVREREIVRLRYFDDLTQRDIAARHNLSQMHVSRLLTRSLAAMQRAAQRRAQLAPA